MINKNWGKKSQLPDSAAWWMRWQGQAETKMLGLICCSLVDTPLWHPIITAALSVPKPRQFWSGMPLMSNSSFIQLKMFSPVDKWSKKDAHIFQIWTYEKYWGFLVLTKFKFFSLKKLVKQI